MLIYTFWVLFSLLLISVLLLVVEAKFNKRYFVNVRTKMDISIGYSYKIIANFYNIIFTKICFIFKNFKIEVIDIIMKPFYILKRRICMISVGIWQGNQKYKKSKVSKNLKKLNLDD